MCFAPQRRALFPHLNFQKWSEPLALVFCTFWLRNVLRAQRRALFPHLNFQKGSEHLVFFLAFWLGNVFRAQRRALFQHLNFQKWSEPLVFCIFWFRNVLRATTACTFSTSQLPKVVREWCILYILTSKCVSRHNGVHFFNVLTAKSGPELVCFVYFDFEMCFAPQRRALFRHLNFQKWSENGVLCIFSLRNARRARTACTFSAS